MNIIHRKSSYLFIFANILLLVSTATSAQSFSSGSRQTGLIELYTSEGCSSCPPAERYLNTYKNHPGLWKRYIPIAWHVDYWDYLGWKDRFASSRHTQRQREFARVNQQRTIYTPGFFVNGKPWRRGWLGQSPKVVDKDVGELRIDISNDQATAVFSPASQKLAAPVLTIAVLGMGLQSSIKAGEREGGVPDHDFVLLNHAQHSSNRHQWTFDLPKFERHGATDLAIVAWVSQRGSPVPVQAVGGYLK